MGTQERADVNRQPGTHVATASADAPEFGILAGDKLELDGRLVAKPGDVVLGADGEVRSYTDGDTVAVVVTHLWRKVKRPALAVAV